MVAVGAATSPGEVVLAGGALPLSTDSVNEPDAPGGAVGTAVSVPFCATALSLNDTKLFSGVGLMAKTMPFPQWVPVRWRQYHPVHPQSAPALYLPHG